MKITVTMTETTSATTIEYQIPSICKNTGRISTAAIWNTSVRRNEIAAEISPLLSAVKNDEPKIENPAKRNENENIENA